MYSRRIMCTLLQLKGFLNEVIINVNQQYLNRITVNLFRYAPYTNTCIHRTVSNNQKCSQEQNKRFVK